MSECNPQCGPGESWADGECRAPLAASAKTLTNTIVIEGGLIAQFVDDEFAAVALAGGLVIGAAIYPTNHPFSLDHG